MEGGDVTVTCSRSTGLIWECVRGAWAAAAAAAVVVVVVGVVGVVIGGWGYEVGGMEDEEVQLAREAFVSGILAGPCQEPLI